MTTTYPNDGPPLALMPEKQYTLAEVAELLGYAPITVRRLTARGKLKAIGSGRLLRYALRDIRAYQEEQRQ